MYLYFLKLTAAHPEDLPADVGDPLFLQGVALGVLDQVGDRAGAAELHDQLRTHTHARGQLLTALEEGSHLGSDLLKNKALTPTISSTQS